jgi:H+/Cl- antiporter ClcA
MKNKLYFFIILYLSTLLFSFLLELSLKINQTINIIVFLLPVYFILKKYNISKNGYIQTLDSLIVHSFGASVGREMVFVQLASQIRKSLTPKISNRLAKGMGLNLFFLAPFSSIKFSGIRETKDKAWIFLTFIISVVLNFLILGGFKHPIYLANIFYILIMPVSALFGFILGKSLHNIIDFLQNIILSFKQKLLIAIVLSIIIWLTPEIRNYGFPGELEKYIPTVQIALLKALVTLAFILLLFPGGYFTPLMLSINVIAYYFLLLLGLNPELSILTSFVFSFSVIMTTLDNNNYIIPVILDVTIFILISRFFHIGGI